MDVEEQPLDNTVTNITIQSQYLLCNVLQILRMEDILEYLIALIYSFTLLFLILFQFQNKK